MNAYEKVVGYETIKNEMLQICDMIHNRDVYAELGAKLPRGILLYGAPGIGKTLMAKCFIEECGLDTYTIRRNKGTGDFVGEITATFRYQSFAWKCKTYRSRGLTLDFCNNRCSEKVA